MPGGGQARDLTENDMEALTDPADAPGRRVGDPGRERGRAAAGAGGRQYRTSVTGTTADYLTVTDRELTAGRGFDAQEERTNAKVVVLGPSPVNELFGGNAAAALGQEIRIGSAVFRVIGAVESTGQQDDVAIMPLGAARSYLHRRRRRAGHHHRAGAVGGGGDGGDEPDHDDPDRPAQHPRPRRARLRRAGAAGSRSRTSTQFLSFLTLFTAAVAGISLIVGSIGVANIMLVTVTERTREIGIRKAIGARPRVILLQFLLESVFLSGLGGLMGIALGVGLALTGAAILPQLVPDFPVPAVDPASIVLAFTVSLLIGLIAGGYPANRASRLRPIEALRYQ